MKIVNSKTLEIASSMDIVRDSLGIVVKDFDDTGNNTLGVYIPRFMFGVEKPEGQFQAYEKDITIDTSILKNKVNKEIGASTVTSKNYLSIRGDIIPGVWQPKYVKGERLKVTFIDQDIKSAHFLPFGMNDSFKRKEDVFRIGVDSKEDEEELDHDDNSYFLEFNARDKYVKFHTSEASGENNPFTIEFNTADGIFTVKDILDSDRGFMWDVNNDTIEFKTEGGSTITYSKGKINMECEEFNLKAENKITMETTELNIKADVGKFNIDDEKHKNNQLTWDSGNIKMKSSALFQLATPDDMLWKPNIVTICPFGFPHGGPLAGISLLKGK